jgi:hypothetical protein
MPGGDEAATILTSADPAVASSPPLSATGSGHMLTLLAGTLAFAAAIARSVSRSAAAGRLGRSDLRDQQRSASNAKWRAAGNPIAARYYNGVRSD